MRSVFALALAGVFGLVTAVRLSSPLREKALRWAGCWLLSGLVLTPLAGFWYFSRFPDFARQYMTGLLPTAQNTARLGLTCAVIAILLALVFTLIRPQWLRTPIVAIMLLACFGTLATGEYLREFVRKPYVIAGYIYANGIRVADAPNIASTGGMRAHALWISPSTANSIEYGKQVFAVQCGSCHSVNGYRSIRKWVRGWDPRFAAAIVPNLSLTRGTMPVFAGDAQDAAALGEYLATIEPAKITVDPTNPLRVGKQVFETKCAMCHSAGGTFRPLAIAGGEIDAIELMVQSLPDIAPQMPPFTGTDAERHALAVWLNSQK